MIEVGEVADIIKKKGDNHIMNDEETRNHFLEELSDVLMYFKVVSSHICKMCGGRFMDKVTVETEDEGVHVKGRYWIYL